MTRTYDKKSRSLAAASGRYRHAHSFTCGASRRKITKTLPVNFAAARTYTISHACDADNREMAITYPHGKIANRACTARDQLGEVGCDSAVAATFTGYPRSPGMRETLRGFVSGLHTALKAGRARAHH